MTRLHQRDQPAERLVSSQVRMNSEARKLLKTQAAARDMTMEDLFHRVLCEAFDRPDLVDRPPSYLLRQPATA